MCCLLLFFFKKKKGNTKPYNRKLLKTNLHAARDLHGNFLRSSWFVEWQAPKDSSETSTDFWYIPSQVIKLYVTSLRILCGALLYFFSCFLTILIFTEAVLCYLFLSTSHFETVVFSPRFVNEQLIFPCEWIYKGRGYFYYCHSIGCKTFVLENNSCQIPNGKQKKKKKSI